MVLKTWISLREGMRNRGFRVGFAFGVGLLLAVFGGAVTLRQVLEARPAIAAPNIPPAKVAAGIELSKAFELVAKGVEPAVVNINTEQIIHNARGASDDPFREFFGDNSPFGSFFGQMPRDMKQKSLGSGFLVDPKGYILTNNHVVEHATKIKVKLDDGRTMDAKVVGTDPQTDLAVLKIDASNLPTIRLANSDPLEVGDWVLAFGSPFGLQKTMTAGIISAKGRVIGAGPYDNFLQTDAAINPGNSGGPLVNLSGEVVGINTMIASESGGFQGIGFAIPSSMASDVYRQILSHGKVTRGWLGVHVQAITPGIAKGFNLSEQKGALVADVDSDSPAARAGIRSGDIILDYAGHQVNDPRDLSFAVAQTAAGASSQVGILRDGKRMNLTVKIGERPGDEAEAVEGSNSERHGRLGITVENITPDAARQMNLQSSKGALVTEVKPGSPADEAGVQPGDVIREINHTPVSSASDVLAVARDLKKGSTVLMKLERQGQALFLSLEIS